MGPIKLLMIIRDRCGITSSQMFEFHTQLQGFIEKNHKDMIDDFDESDEISGFGSDDPAYSDINLDELSFSESDSDEE